jgi:Ca2+/Na+ antiporter
MPSIPLEHHSVDSMIMSSQVPTVFRSPLDSMIMVSSHVSSHSQSQTLSVFDYDWLSLLCLLVLYLLLLYLLVCNLQQSSRKKKKSSRKIGGFTGRQSYIITNCTLIDLTPSSLCRLQLTRQTAFMMTFFVFYFCMLTVKHRL